MNRIIFTRTDTMKKGGLTTKNKTKFNYTKLRLADDYAYESKDEKSEKNEETKVYWRN